LHESSLKHLRCVKCQKTLELEIIRKKEEIHEGFLVCNRCNFRHPIISKIPIIWENLALYLSKRIQLGGYLYSHSTSKEMKSFIKNALSKAKKDVDDISWVEKKWVLIYLASRKAKFYSIIRKILQKLPKSKLALEHGCSVGFVSEILARQNESVFGIDSSYYAIAQAKKNFKQNLDYFVGDSLCHPFGNQKFDLVVGLNLLELIEPKDLIKIISSQIKNGTVVLSDPFDFERGKNTVKNPLYEKTLRNELRKHGFAISSQTRKPSYISWNLNINKRSRLNYKVDLIIGKKS
jgi:2-polyprenyl-3-methyl-5-hydroxy-6-metoxy-1,4-benzoquinol methylase/uncharacterized protein YbaR (Trm112 family)